VKALHIGLAAATIVSAWAFIHVCSPCATRMNIASNAAKDTRATKSRGGLRFPGPKEPDYLDFFYFSLAIGVACATADVEIWAPAMRRTALVHRVLAFFFNSAVLALTINIAAGLV